MESVLDLKNVSLTYYGKKGETQALSNINLTIYKGEFFGIENAMKKTSEPAASVAECGASLMSHLKEYIGNAKQTDDICVVGFQRTGENP